jgi:hypothetical protein
MRAKWQALLAKAQAAPKATAQRVEPRLTTKVLSASDFPEYGPPPSAAPPPEPAEQYRKLPPPRGGAPVAPSQSPQMAQLDAMRKDVQSAGQPDGTPLAAAKGTPMGHEQTPDGLALIRQQAEVDEYGRTLLTLMTQARRTAFESHQAGGPNFVPIRDRRRGKLYLVSASGTDFEFNTLDPADMAHFQRAVSGARMDAREVAAWADMVSEPLSALNAPIGQQQGGATPQGMPSHMMFLDRLKQARTPQEADAIAAEAGLLEGTGLNERLTDNDMPGAPASPPPPQAPRPQARTPPRPRGVAAVLEPELAPGRMFPNRGGPPPMFRNPYQQF